MLIRRRQRAEDPLVARGDALGDTSSNRPSVYRASATAFWSVVLLLLGAIAVLVAMQVFCMYAEDRDEQRKMDRYREYVRERGGTAGY